MITQTGSTPMRAQRISLFYAPKISKISFSSNVQCIQSDKPKLIAFEEARNAYGAALAGAKATPTEKLRLGQQYLEFLVSY